MNMIQLNHTAKTRLPKESMQMLWEELFPIDQKWKLEK